MDRFLGKRKRKSTCYTSSDHHKEQDKKQLSESLYYLTPFLKHPSPYESIAVGIFLFTPLLIIIFSSRKACSEFTYDSFLYMKKEQLLAQFYVKVQNNLFQTAHRKNRAKTTDSSVEIVVEEKEKAPPRARSKFSRDYEMSKINLVFLTDPELYPETREHVANMLLEIYGQSPHRPALIHSKEEALSLLDDLGEAMKGAEANDRFRDFKLTHNQALFYHLLQGTQKFDLEAQLGVIPFEDLFICYLTAPKSILFCQASSLMSISLIFSKEFAGKVVEEEKQNKARLKVEEWHSLIESNADEKYAADAKEWINATSKGPPRVKTVNSDQDTGLRMEGPPAGKPEEELE